MALGLQLDTCSAKFSSVLDEIPNWFPYFTKYET
jgi:hypothetical protein